MRRRLYLIRHALAEPRDSERWPDDADRPLSRRGARRFRQLAVALVPLASPDLVLSSPCMRTWQTALILAERGWPSPRPLMALGSGGPTDVVAALPESGSIALIGHAPNIGRLASLLLTGDADALNFDMKKGAALCLDLEGGVGNAQLLWYAPPSLLGRSRSRG